MPTDGLTPRRWPIEPPEVAVNLHGCGPESHRLLLAAEPAKLWASPTPTPGIPTVPSGWRRNTRCVAGAGSSATTVSAPTGPICPLRYRPIRSRAESRHPSRRQVAVPALAGRPVRGGRPGAVPARPPGRGHRFAGGAGHRGARGRAAGLPRTAALAGRTGIGELAGLVAHARLVISGDTGIAHLATAYGTPSVVLFGPMSPARWGPPPGRPYHRAIWHGVRSEPGDAPGPEVHPALLAIGVDEVLAAASEVERARHAVAAQ